MPKQLITLFVLLPLFSFCQTVIKPGQSVVITADPCPSPTTIIIRDTVWQCPPTPPVVVPPPATGYTLSYSNDYEQKSDINSNQLGRGKQTTFEGRGVFWSEYKAGGAAVSSGYRSEQEYNVKNYPGANPTEGALEIEMYFKDYKPVGWGGQSLQAHPNNNNSALFFLYHTEGAFEFGRSINGANNYQDGTKKIEANRWYKIRVEFRWSTGSDGYFRAFIDNQLYYTFIGKTQDNSGLPYWKIGQNYYSSKLGGIILYDNFFVYKKN